MDSGGQTLWNVLAMYAVCKIFYQMGRLLLTGVLKNYKVLFSGPIIPIGANVEYHPISAQDQARFHQYGKKLLPGFFMGCALHAGGRRSWKGDLLVADVQELQEKDASEVY